MQIAFSPQAALADNIGAADTIIKVTDVSAFPDAPNLATIGTDEEGETILYAAKTADALSGCVRGVEGTAKAWSAGETIGRNWTAKDHTDLIAAVLENRSASAAAKTTAETAQATADTASEALSTKQDKLTGTPGQVVGFSADGSAAAVRGWSNLNLLDNPDFCINQRGKTEYKCTSENVIYAIDRWIVGKGIAKLEVVSDGISISFLSSGFAFIAQKLEPNLTSQLMGKQVTLSVLAKGNGTMRLGAVNVSINKEFSVSSDECMLFSHTFTWTSGNNAWNNTPAIFVIEGQLTIKTAKLELGTQQTLAHQDASGNWVLNDPPPNKALELLKCQRYYWRSKPASSVAETCCFEAASISGENVKLLCHLQPPTAMRARPAIRINGISPGGQVSMRCNSDDTRISGTLQNPSSFVLSEEKLDWIWLYNYTGTPHIGSMYEGTIELDANL